MKVCHVTSAHSRYDGRIFQKQLGSLAKKYDCYLICCDNRGNEEKDGIKIISTNSNFRNRYERFFKAKKLLKKKCIDLNADIYQLHDSDLLELALYLKKKNKIVIFDAHEDYEALFLEREWIPKYLRRTLLKMYIIKEKIILSKLDFIICAASHIKDKLIKYNKNIAVIENFPILREKMCKAKVNSKENIICFAGSIRKDWNHEIIIKSIANIKNIKYKIAGSYSKDYYESLSLVKGFKKTVFLGRLNVNEVQELYTDSKIGMALCSYLPNTNYKVGSLGNTKIFEYMMNDLPVIFTDFELYKCINSERQFGIAVNPYSEKEVKNAILYLLSHPKEAKQMGKNGKLLVQEKYNWNVLERKLYEIYQRFEREK